MYEGARPNPKVVPRGATGKRATGHFRKHFIDRLIDHGIDIQDPIFIRPPP